MPMIQLDSELVSQALARVQDNLFLPDLRLSQRSPIEALIRAVEEASTVSQPAEGAIAACPGCGTPTGRCEECGEVVGPDPVPLAEALDRASSRNGRPARRVPRRRPSGRALTPTPNVYGGYHRTRAVAAGLIPADDVASTEEDQEAVRLEPLNVVVGAMDIICPTCGIGPGEQCVFMGDGAQRRTSHVDRISEAQRLTVQRYTAS